MVIWLVHPLSAQIGVTGLEWTLVFYVVVGMACWLLGKIQITMPTLIRWKFRMTAGTLVVATCLLVYGWIYPLGKAAIGAQCEREAVLTCNHDGEIEWSVWSPQAVEAAVRSGKLAFVDFTAAYCTVCKVNKKVAIETPQFTEKLITLGAVAFRADFTDYDQEIADALLKYKGSNLVPLNLIYPPGRPDKPLVLETNLTTA
jgi:thiol:disulfide interchange protein